MTATPTRVLFADDELGTRLLVRAALLKAGFEVTLASNGREALHEFRQTPHDVVMLDVEMPEMNGHEVCAALRREAGELLPIVMLTGMKDVASIERAYDSGATDFIAKPVNWTLLGHRLRYLMRAYRAQLDLKLAEARNQAILDAIPDLVFELDLEGRFLDCHVPASERDAGPVKAFVGKTLAEVMSREVVEVGQAALAEAAEHGLSIGKQYAVHLPQGTRWFELSVSRKANADGQAPRFIALSRDITERKEAESRIARLAFFDPLTGLPNRPSFLDRVDREIQRARQRQTQLAVLFLDLDGFKGVNDAMGHAAGDLILQLAADRLSEGLRPSDVVARAGPPAAEIELARLGGDEFTALIVDVQQPEDALIAAKRICDLMRRPFSLEGRAVTLTTSIGIALFPGDGLDAATLLKHADTAMYCAKDGGRDGAQLYSAALTERAQRNLELDTSLRAALDNGEFHLVYQPQIDPLTGRADSVEALVRWAHPTRGEIAPLDFIPLAEQNGLIEAIGLWVLRTACADAVRWQAAGAQVSVAVNLSPVQFKGHNLLPAVANALQQTGLPPSLLELELTESALMERTETTIAMLHALCESGVRIALDDFGTGYSSLNYLTRMPISRIKIDRSFIHGLQERGENAAIVRAVVAMAGSLGISVTAEGVETLGQAQALRTMACDRLQGFYFSRPVPADAVPGLLRQQWVLA